MNCLLVGSLLVILVLAFALVLRKNKITGLETKIIRLEGERDILQQKCNLLSKQLLKANETIEEIKKIEEEKNKKKGTRKKPPESGDSAARLDRLDKLSDK